MMGLINSFLEEQRDLGTCRFPEARQSSFPAGHNAQYGQFNAILDTFDVQKTRTPLYLCPYVVAGGEKYPILYNVDTNETCVGDLRAGIEY